MMILLLAGVLLAGGCTDRHPDPVAEFTYEPEQVKVHQEVAFDATASEAPGGEIVEYAWAFGDGTSGAGPTPTHTYESPGVYPVELTVIDDQGASASVSRELEVEPAPDDGPLAVFATVPWEGPAPLTVNFDASASEGDIAEYSWEFDDGNVAQGVEVSHTYEAPGAYTARLTVEDDHGRQDTTTRRITVREPGDVVPLKASFTVDRNPAEVGESVSFDASDSTGDIVEYRWEFGDEATAVGMTVQHTYTSDGVHEVRLTVEDADGATDTAEENVYIFPALPPPPGNVEM